MNIAIVEQNKPYRESLKIKHYQYNNNTNINHYEKQAN